MARNPYHGPSGIDGNPNTIDNSNGFDFDWEIGDQTEQFEEQSPDRLPLYLIQC